MKLHCKSYWAYTVNDFIGYLFSLYYCCLMCLRLAKSKVQLRVSEWAIPEKFFYFNPEKVFYFTPEKFHILNPNPLLPVFVFFHYSVCTVISDCNHSFDTSTFTHTVSQEYINCDENTYLEFFWNQTFLIFHKRNFNPKVVNYF